MVAAPGGTVKLPLLGSQPKKHIIILGGVGAGVLGVAYYRSKKAASATPAATTAQIDPSTGFTYGSPEDAAALAQQASYSSPGGAGGGNGTGAGGGGSGTGTGPTGTIVDNETWSQTAETYLVGVVGLDSGTVSSALGAYISAATLTDAQVSIVQQAIAAVGYPPTPGTTGYPPSYHTATTPPSGGNTTPPPGTVKPVQLQRPVMWIQQHSPGETRFAWSTIPNAAQYAVFLNGALHLYTASQTLTVATPGTYSVVAKPATSGASLGRYTDSPISAGLPITVLPK